MKLVEDEAIKSGKAILLCANALRHYDERLVDHGARVAYIAMKIIDNMAEVDREKFILKDIVLLSLFHDVGAYETEEIDRMIEFESTDVDRHSIYGYLFLKNFTPLSERSEAIRYHHTPAWKIPNEFEYKEYAELIHLADRVDVLYMSGKDVSFADKWIAGEVGKEADCKVSKEADCELSLGKDDNRLSEPTNCKYNMNQLKALKHAIDDNGLLKGLADGNWKKEIKQIILPLNLSIHEMLEYLKMLIHTIDFKSAVTMSHSVDTTVVSCFIAEKLGMTDEEQEKIMLGSMVHDIGKIRIPNEILEFPGKLSFEQMKVMKLHAAYTAEIIGDLLPEEIKRIASRHHEKLNGKGYPDGLMAADLTTSERIVAVADIISALLGRRSYKDEFPMDRAVKILEDMSADGSLDKDIVRLVIDNAKDLADEIKRVNTPIVKKFANIKMEYSQIITEQI